MKDTIVAAFVARPSRGVVSHVTQFILPGAVKQTALHANRWADYSASASSYFTSTRTPAALIAGSAIASLYQLVERVQEKDLSKQSRLQNVVLIMYYVMMLASLFLELNVVVMATATSNALLLGIDNPMATSAYELLQRELTYEFAMTRWSFFMGLFSFLSGVGIRALLEFNLLVRRRTRSALTVVLAVSSFMFHLFAVVNQKLKSWPHMGSMTMDVASQFFRRSLTFRKNPSELISVACFVGAVIMGLLVLRNTGTSSKPANNTEEAD